jgi:hypothetical protein
MNYLSIIFAILSFSVFSQQEYTPTKEHPFGQLNPNAPKELSDFSELIGLCDCKSQSRNQDGTWADEIPMTWTFKYIMNGMAIQDETIKEDGKHSGSIRQFDIKNNHWNIYYYSVNSSPKSLPVWTGNKENNKIILYRNKKSPNGMDGYYRLTFSEISNKGYNWVGEWVDKDEKIIYPTWKITCQKRGY